MKLNQVLLRTKTSESRPADQQTSRPVTVSSAESKMQADSFTCALINGAFTIFNIVGNVFFIFCMVCPLHGERIKQPLKLLLGSFTCCTATYLVSAVVEFCYGLTTNGSENFNLALNVVFFSNLSISITSSVWLSFFYYTQIVPAQRALFIWIKKNIKLVIYCIWLVVKIFTFFDVVVMLINSDTLTIPDISSYNVTVNPGTVHLPLFEIAFCIVKFHFIFCVCVMVMSSGSTVVYLCRHMRRMVASGQSFSHSRFGSQVRVTITGILQGVMLVFCTVWTFYHPNPNSCVQFTVINLYMAGTTVSLGAGQAVFRQRAADIWFRAAQWCKTPKVKPSEQGG